MPLTDVAMAIDAFAVNVTRRRYQPTTDTGLYDETGRWDDASQLALDPVDSVISAVVLAMRPHDVMDLPEGIRAEAQWLLWTRTVLLVDDETTGRRGDEFLIADEWCRIVMVWPRREGGYTKCALGVIRDRGRSVHAAG